MKTNLNSPAVLNIGLAVEGGADLNPIDVRYAIADLDRNIGRAKLKRSETEDTLVLEIDRPFKRTELYELCDRLNQDCIAQRFADGTGELVGPRATKWGAFNPEYFLNF